jgi:activator of HSP90 ATPase
MKESLNEANQKIKALEEAAVKSSLKTTNNSNLVDPDHFWGNSDHLKSLAVSNDWIGFVSEIELEETFKCTRMELFKTFTQPKLIQAFTHNTVIMAGDAKAGVEFTLLDGNINGTYTGYLIAKCKK